MGCARVRGQGQEDLRLYECDVQTQRCVAQFATRSVSPSSAEPPFNCDPHGCCPSAYLRSDWQRRSVGGGGPPALDWQTNDEHPEGGWRVAVRGRRPVERVRAELRNQRQCGRANKGVSFYLHASGCWLAGWATIVSGAPLISECVAVRISRNMFFYICGKGQRFFF